MPSLRTFPLPATLTPPQVARAWRRRGPIVVLESGRPSAAHGEQTLVAGLPLAEFVCKRGRSVLGPRRGRLPWPEASELAAAASPFHALERCVAALGRDAPPPFGAYGFFGYEALAPPDAPRLLAWPDGWFLLIDTVVRWERPGAAPQLHCGHEGMALELVAELEAIVATSRRRASAPGSTSDESLPGVAPPAELPSSILLPDLDLAGYSARFGQVRAALARGDSYQLCLTYPFERLLPIRGAEALWRRLRLENPAPFSAWLDHDRFSLVSCSPERFVRVGPGGRVEARPMKGTLAKPDDAAAVAAAARGMGDSTKTLSENLMIADLLRNDLGRVCRLGSVRASQPALVEEHATLLQMVSVIEGELAAGRTAADLLESAFPPGSMTGAPKRRSIELLQEIEGAPRGPYSGILGWLGSDGTCDWSVVIRTAACADGLARVGVGGGIVWDSTAPEEWEESRAKGAPLLRAIAAAAPERLP